jgi:hypothetical protein
MDVPVLRGRRGHFYTSQDEEAVEVYLYRAIQPDWALSGSLRYEQVRNTRINPNEIDTVTAPVQARWFSASGLFASLGATYVQQDVSNNINASTEGSDRGVLFNASFGFRLPDRHGIVSLDVRNLLDTRIRYQDLSYLSNDPDLRANLDQPIRPDLTVVARITLNF